MPDRFYSFLYQFPGVIALSSLIGNYYLNKIFKFTFKSSAATYIALSAILYVYSKILKRQTVSKMMETSIVIQKRALSNFKPDIIIGSSWGGAVINLFHILY